MTINSNQLINLSNRYGTPLYVYDGDLIIQRYNELYDFIKWPRLRILYAMKANYNFNIIKMLNENNAYLDTVSPGDVLLALKAGYSPDRLLFTANNLTDEEVNLVHSLGVLFNIDSLSRLEKYGKIYPNSNVCIRFNPDVVAGENEKVQTAGDLTKFGILLKDLPKVLDIVSKYNLKVVGLHEHTGSGISDTNKFLEGANNLLEIAKKENFPNLRFIDFGGGFKVPYKKDEKRIDYITFGEQLSKRFSEFCEQYGKELELYFEPGKYVVAESGHLLVKVNTLKNNHGRLIAGTDSGFPQLIRPVFYGAHHDIINLTNPNGKLQFYDICGNICESGDNFATERELPEIREDDILAIKNAGAYCYSMGGIYNLRAMPPEILILNKQPKLIRRRLSNEELINQIISECDVS